MMFDWERTGGQGVGRLDNAEKRLILNEATLELHCGHDRSVGRFDVTLDEDIGIDTDGMLGEIYNRLWDGSCKPAFAKNGFKPGLDNVELDNGLEVFG